MNAPAKLIEVLPQTVEFKLDGNTIHAYEGETILKAAKLTESTGEANRHIEGGAVRIDGTVISDKALKLGVGAYVMQVGKRRFAKVVLR